jgi:hypothetical protein
MRLLKVPACLPLSLIENALAKVKGYLKDSATFETYANDRKVRNGNLTFYVDGLVVGTPWHHLRVDGFDLRMDNPSYPNHPDVTIPTSSASAPIPAKAKESQPPQASPSTNPTAPLQLQQLSQPPQAPSLSSPTVTQPLSQPSASTPASLPVTLPSLLLEPNGSSSHPPPKRPLSDTEFTLVVAKAKKSRGKKDKDKNQSSSAVEMSVDPKERSLTLPPPALTKAHQFAAAHAAHWSNDQ